MVSMRQCVAFTAIGLLAGSCTILSYTWTTPATVAPGSIFTMELTGTTNVSPAPVGVVFQVPNGFTVLDASVTVALSTAPTTLVRDEPALLAMYTPDPNHHLASFSGQGLVVKVSSISCRLKVYVQAPPVPGNYQLEMALASFGSPTWTPQLGLGSFQAAGGSVLRPLQITGTPSAPPFALTAALFDVAPNDVKDVEAGDVDGDGRDDLVELGAAGFRVRRSVPGGFALPGATVPSTVLPRDCAIADFDGDGFADVALSWGLVAFSNGGTSWTTSTVNHGLSITTVAAGDVDGDGIGDVAFANQDAIVVFRGQGNRVFLPWSTGLPTGVVGTPGSLQVVDLDHDGRAELVNARPVGTQPSSRVFRSTPQGVWSLVGTMPGTSAVLVIDVDGNGTKELLPTGAGQVYTYSPAGLVAAPFAGPTTFTRAVALDFDRDGREDIALGVAGVFGSPVQPRIELWRNSGGVFVAVPLPAAAGFTVLFELTNLVAGDFDDDTFPDLCATTDRVLAWHNSQHAVVAGYGEGCAPPGGVAPDISVVGSIAPGQSGVLQLANALPNGGTLMCLGPSKTMCNGLPQLPFDFGPFGAPGCTVLAEPIVIVGSIANGSGVASVPFSVPPLPPTAEVTLFVQGAAMVPAANPLGLVFSRGLALKIQ